MLIIVIAVWEPQIQLIYNLFNFQPLCEVEVSASWILHIFIGSYRKDHICLEPVIGGLSDHDANLIVVKNIESVLNIIITRNKADFWVMTVLKHLSTVLLPKNLSACKELALQCMVLIDSCLS
jgi:hypothetical protein